MPGRRAGSGDGQVQCREPKTGQQKVQLSSKTKHFAHLGMIYLFNQMAWMLVPFFKNEKPNVNSMRTTVCCLGLVE